MSQALATSVKVSPRKLGLVAALVRGRTVEDALVILEHTPKKAAPVLAKIITSAKANATNNHNYKEEGLVIKQLDIGHGMRIKRYRPGAFGRAKPYVHRTSNVRVVLDGTIRQPKPSKSTKSVKKSDDKSTKEKK